MTDRILSPADVAHIRQRAGRSGDPCAEALAELLAKADQAGGKKPVHIRENGGSPWYRVDANYIEGKDGVFNAESNTECSRLTHEAGATALDCALAWRLTDEPRYAETALRQIAAWCLDQDTRMFPSGRVVDPFTAGGVHRYGGDIHIFEAFPTFFLACSLMQSCPQWKLAPRGAVKDWIRDMLAPQRGPQFYAGYEMTNNWEDARLRYLACGAAAIDDCELLTYVFDRWRLTLPVKMTPAGELPRETERTRSMTYTLMALFLSTVNAELAWRHGIDNYAYTAQGRSLKLGIDFAARHLLDLKTWPFQLIEPMPATLGDRLVIFALAGRRYGTDAYQGVIERWGGVRSISPAGRLLWLHAGTGTAG